MREQPSGGQTQDLPSGLVTFLFSDIESSTELLLRHGDTHYVAVLSQLREMLGSLVSDQGGRAVAVGGDGALYAFARVSAAVAAAVAAQRAIAAHTDISGSGLRVRMGLHTGEAPQIGHDYAGLDVHRAARICSAGHGGQVLLSQTTAEALGGELPRDVRLRDLGSHRLRGLRQPEKLYQVTAAGLEDRFPPLRSLEAFPHNLPRQLTSFVGRERELRALKQVASETALVTLVGPGGCGKTRLALQVVTEILEHYRDGVWLVELDALSDPGLIPQAVADALGLREVPGRDLVTLLLDYFRSRKLLLVLDNCEHLVTACAPFVAQVLRASAGVHILATSREPLGVAGEHVWRVAPLSVPRPRETAEAVFKSEAVRLFRERAASARPGFVGTAADAPAIAELCRQLDGIPLAIELAAARMSVLSVEEIVVRLADRFRILTGERTAPPRHQTLQAVLDWSYHLLSDHERVLLSRLSVFGGGWTLEAAEQVCVGGELEASDILNLQGQLVSKSLVQVNDREGRMRFWCLETIRQYGRAKLRESGGERETRKMHCEWCLGLATGAEPELEGVGQAVSLNYLEAELDNLRVALDWCLDNGGFEAGLRIAASLRRFWLIRGHLTEGRKWLETFLERSAGVPEDVRARAMQTAGVIAVFGQSDYEGGRAWYERAISIYRHLGDDKEVADLLNGLGVVAFGQGDFEAARDLYGQSLALRRRLGDQRGVAVCLHNLGRLAHHARHDEQARTLLEASLAIMRDLGDEENVAGALTNLGSVAINLGDRNLATRVLLQGLAIEERLGDTRRIGYSFEGFATLAAARGNLPRAVKLFSAAEALRESIGAYLPPADQKQHDRSVALIRAQMSPTAFSDAWTVGRSLSVQDAIQECREGELVES